MQRKYKKEEYFQFFQMDNIDPIAQLNKLF